MGNFFYALLVGGIAVYHLGWWALLYVTLATIHKAGR